MDKTEEIDITDADERILDQVWNQAPKPPTAHTQALTGAVAQAVHDDAGQDVLDELASMAGEKWEPDQPDPDEKHIDHRRRDKVQAWIMERATAKHRQPVGIRAANQIPKDFDPSEARDPDGKWQGSGAKPQPAADPPVQQEQPKAKPKNAIEAAERHGTHAGHAVAEVASEFADRYSELADIAHNPQADPQQIDSDAAGHIAAAKDSFAGRLADQAHAFDDAITGEFGAMDETSRSELDELVNDMNQEFADKIDAYAAAPGKLAQARQANDHEQAAGYKDQIDAIEGAFQDLADDFTDRLSDLSHRIVREHEFARTPAPEAKPEPATPDHASHIKAEPLAKGHIQKFKEALEQITDKPVLKQVKSGLRFMKKITDGYHNFLAERYGRKTAAVIMASGLAADLATSGIGALAGKVIYVPGLTVLGSLPAAALAETYLQARKLMSKGDVDLDDQDALKAFKEEFWAPIQQEWNDWLTANAEQLEKDMNAAQA